MKCQVIMPFAAEFNAVFEMAREATHAGVGSPVDCIWLKDVKAAGSITDDIVESLTEAAFCIADVTGNNPNVMWEAGYAMALGKPTILIGQNVERLPFDLAHHRLLEYRRDALERLREDLEEAVRQTVMRLGSARLRPLPAHLYWLGHDLGRAIRLAMSESGNRVELERNLFGALHHLEQIQLPAGDCRRLILQSLAAVRAETAPDSSELTGWIAQAKNDLGDLIAETQVNFRAYPTPGERRQWAADADALRVN